MEQPVEEHLYLYPPKENDWEDEDEKTIDLMYELYREITLFLGPYHE